MLENQLKKYLINIVLMDDVDCFADVDFVSPPSNKTAWSSSLILSLPNSARFLSEWLPTTVK